MKDQRDEEIYLLFRELLEKYEESEKLCINDRSGNIVEDLVELENEVKQYENKIKELLGR